MIACSCVSFLAGGRRLNESRSRTWQAGAAHLLEACLLKSGLCFQGAQGLTPAAAGEYITDRSVNNSLALGGLYRRASLPSRRSTPSLPHIHRS